MRIDPRDGEVFAGSFKDRQEAEDSARDLAERTSQRVEVWYVEPVAVWPSVHGSKSNESHKKARG